MAEKMAERKSVKKLVYQVSNRRIKNKRRKVQKLVVFSQTQYPRAGESNEIFQNSVTIDGYIWKYITHAKKQKLDAISRGGPVGISAVPEGGLVLLTVSGADEGKTRIAKHEILKLRNDAVSNMSTERLPFGGELSEENQKHIKGCRNKWSDFLIEVDNATHTVVVIGPADKMGEVKAMLEKVLSGKEPLHQTDVTEVKVIADVLSSAHKNDRSQGIQEFPSHGEEVQIFITEPLEDPLCPLEPPPEVAFQIVVDQSKINPKKCLLCSNNVVEPFKVTCGHIYCKRCIISWLREKLILPS